ncbi:MAG: type II secretion system protein [Tenericutes bacterium]|nr:type II secretion system protein [Mycoplasmatota bacterium]
MRNKHGLTLVELLGAIVVFGILISISAMVIDYFIDANNRSNISSQANFEGLLAIRTMKNSMDDLGPTEYDTCPGTNCLIVQSAYSYEYNEETNAIDLVVYDDPLEYKIEIDNNVLYINDVEYIFEGFELTSNSDLAYEEINSVLFITLTLYLSAGDQYTYEYVMSYSYDLTNIPVG